MRPIAAVAVAAVIAAAAPARAQQGVRLSTQLSKRRAEVGESFRLQLTALVESGDQSPASPRLQVSPGILAQGPSVTTQRQVSIAGGQIQHRQGITATWTLSGTRPGKFTIGPASVVVRGQRVSGERVTVEIVAQGSAGPGGRRGRGWPFDPLDPFGQFPGFQRLPGFGFDDEPSDEDLIDRLPPFPEQLRTDRALDRTAFLRATVSPSRAVVGQQMTLRVYAYGRRGPFREVNTSEPSRPDFVSYPIVENSYGRRLHRVPIQGEVWHALKIREVALFPIRAGRLAIGPMRMGFDGRRYPSSGRHKGLVRESAPVQVTVTEPPTANRPTGYRLGDVGRFELTASVQPREVTAGEAISVVVTLKGTGNLPFTVRTPQQHGVEWLQPTVVDDIDVGSSTVSGWRKFTYVVRLESPGQIDLGEVTLPYWDPWQSTYQTARTGLGLVQVQPSTDTAQPKADEPVDPLEALAEPRAELGAPSSTPLRPAHRWWFWGMLALGPALVVGARGTTALHRKVRERWRARQVAHQTVAAQALKQAESKAAGGDLAAVASLVERAVFTALEGAVGLRARAILREDLSDRLAQSGVPAEVAEETISLLEALDSVRFTGAAGEHSPEELVHRARKLVGRLGRLASGRRRGKGEA